MRECVPVINYQSNIEEFLAHSWNKYDLSFSQPMIKYFLGNYDDFVTVRANELSLNKNSLLFKLKMIISNPIIFKKYKEQWADIKRIIKQTYYFTNKENEQFNIPFEKEYFYIDKKIFNIIKNFWQPYIDYLINKNETLKIQKKVKDF